MRSESKTASHLAEPNPSLSSSGVAFAGICQEPRGPRTEAAERDNVVRGTLTFDACALTCAYSAMFSAASVVGSISVLGSRQSFDLAGGRGTILTMLRTLLIAVAGLLVIAPLCGTGMTVTFTYSNQDVDAVTFSSRMGTTGSWLDSGITVPADSSVTTSPHAVKKDFWFSCVVKDAQSVTLDSVVIAGYEWTAGSSVTWAWDGTDLTPYVFIP
jgi:hypothetical protein